MIEIKELIFQMKKYMQQDHVVMVDKELGPTTTNPAYLMRHAISIMETQEYEYQNLLEEHKELSWRMQKLER